jgi:hypothetical protein
MTDPILLMAFAYSTKIKSDRQKARAIAAEKEKSKITNYAFGKDGIRAVAPNANLKQGEKLYGFSVGNSGTINKFPEAELPLIDLYENPLDPNRGLVSQKQYNSIVLPQGNINVDPAPSITTKKPPLGMVVAQRSPANNKLFLMEGYKPFNLSEVTDTEFVKLVNGKPVKVKENEKATHTITVKKKGNTVVSRSAPVKIDKDKQETQTVETGILTNGSFTTKIPEGGAATHERIIKKIDGVTVSTGKASLIAKPEAKEPETLYEYYNEKGDVTTNVADIASQRPYKMIDGKKQFVGKIEDRTGGKKDEPVKINFLYDKDGERTQDESQAVQQQMMTFNVNGELIEEGELKEVKKFEPKEKDVNKSKTEYMIQEIDNPRNTTFTDEADAMAKQAEGTHNIIKYRTYNEKGVAGELKAFSLVDKANAKDKAVRSKDVIGTVQFATEEKDTNLKTIYKGVSFFRNQTGEQNLSGLNNFLIQNPKFLETANTDQTTEQQLRTLIIPALRSYFLGEKQGGDGKVHFTRTMPKSPKKAYRLAGSQFLALSKLKNFKEYSLLAANLADEKVMNDLIQNAEVGESNIIVKKNIVENDKVVGTVYAAVGVPEQYKSTIETMSGYIGDVRDKEDVGGLIERLVVYETDDKGMIKKRDNGDGTFSNIPSQNQPALDFVETLVKTSLGKNVNGRPATMFDAFLSMIHPFPDEHPVGTINTQLQNDIKKKFAVLSQYDFKKAMNLIAAFTAKNSAATNILMEQFHGENFSEEKVKADLRGKSTSAYNGIMTIDAMERTYFTEDGQFIDVNTKQGEYAVTAVGIYQTGKKFVKGIFRGGKVLDLALTDSNELANSLVNQSDLYESVNSNDPKEMEARAANNEVFNNIKNVISGAGDINAFVKNLPKAMQQQLGGDRGTEVLRKLAIRQYHKYMLAYQLAAAIQGGTGGRTISDQDVQNILQSLNFGVFTPAAVEVATLRTARKMLTQLYDYNEALLNPNPSMQFAGYKAQQLLMGAKRGALLSTIAERRKFITNTMFSITGAKFGKDSASGNVSNFAKEKQKRVEDLILKGTP